MLINKNIQPFIVYEEGHLIDGLNKINENKKRVVFAVSEHGKLVGSLSDGDVRRWITDQSSLDLQVKIKDVMNSACTSFAIGSSPDSINKYFKSGVDAIPLVDERGHLIAIAEKNTHTLFIGKHPISDQSPSFIIAEIGNNHQGDIDLAKKLVDLVVDAKVDCAKFQMRNVKQMYRNEGESSDASADLGAQYTLDLLSKYQLSNDELFEVFDYCREKGVTPLCTPWDLDSLKALEKYGMLAYKVASADFTNFELLSAIAKTGKPFICSTGMSSEAEIKSTTAFLDGLGANYALLHCNSTYPTPFKDVNLKYISRLKEITGKIVGYSGHERGYNVAVASVALGAKIVEKHVTIDKSLEGTDHKVSLLPDEFAEMVIQIRQLEESLGTDEEPREISQGELLNREVLAKSLIINCDLKKDQCIERSMIDIKSPGQGLQPNRIDELVGKIAKHDFCVGDYFYETDISGELEKKSSYSFDRPYGIPVRYHDYAKLTSDVDLDFVEFHLSYNDLEEDFRKFITEPQDIGFAIHSPELFANDHIMDLSAYDEGYRKQSIDYLKRVIDVTRDIGELFPKTNNPVIVVNVGGWDSDGFISAEDKARKYSLVADALRTIDSTGVQIAIQTMPPFPWHFGGQSFHNIFLSAEEIDEFCRENDAKMCLDVSHSMMACNYYKWDFEQFISKVAPHSVHLHVVDAKGIDGEGVEVGGGDVDFKVLGKLLAKHAANVQFIPEVWQGHKNSGQGFWGALSYLEKAWKTDGA